VFSVGSLRRVLTTVPIQVFDRYITTLNLPFEIQVESDAPHKDLTKPDRRYGSGIGAKLGREPYGKP
jgi:hypothetical protein